MQTTDRTGSSRLRTELFTTNGVTSAVTPRISAILVTFEPMALPIASPDLP